MPDRESRCSWLARLDRRAPLLSRVVGCILIAGAASAPYTAAQAVTQIIDATGDGAGNSLSAPFAIAVDGVGNVALTALGSTNAFKITPAGAIVQIIDAMGDGAGNPLGSPLGSAMGASESVYVTGFSSNNAFRIAADGVVTAIIDSGGDGSGNLLDGPRDIVVDGSGRALLTGGTTNNVFEVLADGTITQIIDASGDGAGNLVDAPVGIAVDEFGAVYVTGTASNNAFKVAELCQTDLGFGGPGGIMLDICGDDLTLPGSVAMLSIEGATPLSTVFLPAGTVNNPTPLQGGILVPFPFLAAFPFSTDANGVAASPISGTGGPAVTLYLQVVDTNPAQWQFSNALEIVIGT